MTNIAPSKLYGRGWKEVYSGGSPEVEARQFATFTEKIKRVQEQIKQREHAPFIRRAFHAKIHAGITDHVGIANAEFHVLPDISRGPAHRLLPALGNLSSNCPLFERVRQPFNRMQRRDLRGVALRVVTDQGNVP